MKSELGPPMTLGNAAAARVRLIVWCLDCRHQAHQAEPDPAGMAERLWPQDDGWSMVGAVFGFGQIKGNSRVRS